MEENTNTVLCEHEKSFCTCCDSISILKTMSSLSCSCHTIFDKHLFLFQPRQKLKSMWLWCFSADEVTYRRSHHSRCLFHFSLSFYSQPSLHHNTTQHNTLDKHLPAPERDEVWNEVISTEIWEFHTRVFMSSVNVSHVLQLRRRCVMDTHDEEHVRVLLPDVESDAADSLDVNTLFLVFFLTRPSVDRISSCVEVPW